jgi:Xaa-Pro aminopeptidase
MSTDSKPIVARLAAGVPQINSSLFWRTRFHAVDQIVLVEIPNEHSSVSTLILRDIDMGRARQHARVDQVACPAMFAPEDGLSGDREIANAQAAVELLRRSGISYLLGDRSLPLIFSDMARKAGITVECDPDCWLNERRQKSEEEIEHLRTAQRVTEGAIQLACELIARADVRADGVLIHEGSALTSERVRAAIDHWLLDRNFSNPSSIVAGGPIAADCHHYGAGDLRTGEPVIVDIFPQDRSSHYNGDCTRTVVHGDIPDEVIRMHAAVRAAKSAAERTIAVGVTGEAVHRATIDSLIDSGYTFGLPGDDDPNSYCGMTHGTGHGIGLDVHEPPLLDKKGGPLLAGEALTVEPGLYRRDLGAVRLEDMVIVTETGCLNLNTLHDELRWK